MRPRYPAASRAVEPGNDHHRVFDQLAPANRQTTGTAPATGSASRGKSKTPMRCCWAAARKRPLGHGSGRKISRNALGSGDQCGRMVSKQEVIQLSENADSDLGPAWSSRIRAIFERYIPPGRPAFTDPAVDRFRPLLEFCHLEGSDQPCETQLQTAWVSFGQQMRVTFVGPRRIAHDGTSGSPLFRKEPTEPGMPPAGERFEHEFSKPRSFILRR